MMLCQTMDEVLAKTIQYLTIEILNAQDNEKNVRLVLRRRIRAFSPAS